MAGDAPAPRRGREEFRLSAVLAVARFAFVPAKAGDPGLICKPWIPAYAGMSGGYLENLALQPRVPYRPPHALWRRRHFDMAHAENRKRIDDGVDDHGEGRHRAAFAGRADGWMTGLRLIRSRRTAGRRRAASHSP